MITRKIGKKGVGRGSAEVKLIAWVRKAKTPVRRSDLLLAEEPILRTLRRIRGRGRIERLFG